MRIITLNLRHDADRWLERFSLVVNELISEDADVICFQEVARSNAQAHMIAEKLNEHLNENHYQVFVEYKWGVDSKEGIGILSRLHVQESERIELPEGGRIAQRIRISVTGGHTIDIVNTHLHHLPKDDDAIRLKQLEYLLEWIASKVIQCQQSWLLIGDLNSIPNSRVVNYLKENLASAYETIHRHEPRSTFPTSLVDQVGEWYEPRTLDYVFYEPSRFEISDARLAFTKSHASDPSLMSSDHFGLVVDFELMQK
jgi:endonuclease/exonuclease/phosphatase family metal-dependent hydrolase